MGIVRAVWVDAGNDPNYAELRAQGITVPFFDIREERLTPEYLDNVVAHPGIEHVGYFVASSWFPQYTATDLAEYVDRRMKQIGWAGNALIQFDIEGAGSPQFACDCFRRWRFLRPKRETYFTMEGHQAANYTMEQVRALQVANVGLCPQCYNGAMTQVWDAWAMSKDWLEKGFTYSALYPFYDAAHLPYWWQGFAFTQGRLPAA